MKTFILSAGIVLVVFSCNKTTSCECERNILDKETNTNSKSTFVVESEDCAIHEATIENNDIKDETSCKQK